MAFTESGLIKIAKMDKDTFDRYSKIYASAIKGGAAGNEMHQALQKKQLALGGMALTGLAAGTMYGSHKLTQLLQKKFNRKAYDQNKSYQAARLEHYRKNPAGALANELGEGYFALLTASQLAKQALGRATI